MLLRIPRRHFLGGLLPGASSRGKGRKEHFQKVVNHKTSSIYQVVADVQSYSAFLPYCLASRVLERDNNELTAEVTVGFSDMRSKFASKVSLTPLERVHAVSEPNEFIEHLNFTWEFGALGEKACRLDITLDFALRQEAHTLMWDLVQDKIISDYVRSFSQRCSALEREAARG